MKMRRLDAVGMWGGDKSRVGRGMIRYGLGQCRRGRVRGVNKDSVYEVSWCI